MFRFKDYGDYRNSPQYTKDEKRERQVSSATIWKRAREGGMDESRARTILEEMDVLPDASDGLRGEIWVVNVERGTGISSMTGDFDADQLEAIAWWLRHKAQNSTLDC